MHRQIQIDRSICIHVYIFSCSTVHRAERPHQRKDPLPLHEFVGDLHFMYFSCNFTESIPVRIIFFFLSPALHRWRVSCSSLYFSRLISFSPLTPLGVGAAGLSSLSSKPTGTAPHVQVEKKNGRSISPRRTSSPSPSKAHRERCKRKTNQ